MWVKEGRQFFNPLEYNGFKIWNPSDEQLTAAGYQWVDDEPYEPVEIPKRYSTLKIIRALGKQWSIYRDMLEQAGVLDQFFAANYLSEDDEVFTAFMENVPEEVKSRLDECIWSND